MNRKHETPGMAALRIALLILASLSAALAANAGKDRVVLQSGRALPRVTILREQYDKVEVDRDGDGVADDTFAGHEVKSISYGDSPIVFREGVSRFGSGRFAQAVEKMNQALKSKEVSSPRLRHHAYFIIGESLRRMAETDKTLLPKARQACKQAAAVSPKGRLIPDVARCIGLCLMAEGKVEQARTEFNKLLDKTEFGAAWAVRGKILLARVHGMEGTHEAGLKLCDEAVQEATAAGNKKLAKTAVFARAELLLTAKQYEKSYKEFLKIAEEAGSADYKTKARAYNGVGDALLSANRTREARLAYLRVRVLYFKDRDELPHGLYGAARCFSILKERNKTRELVAILEKDYPNSIWTVRAKKLIAGG
jgi:tetratricopeptide (TPR) repeat protein